MTLDVKIPSKVHRAIGVVIDFLEKNGVSQEGPDYREDFELLWLLVKLADGNWHEAEYRWEVIRDTMKDWESS